MADSLIELHDLKKEFDGTPVLRGISLDIKSREFVTLLGPSGCGKTVGLTVIPFDIHIMHRSAEAQA